MPLLHPDWAPLATSPSPSGSPHMPGFVTAPPHFPVVMKAWYLERFGGNVQDGVVEPLEIVGTSVDAPTDAELEASLPALADLAERVFDYAPDALVVAPRGGIIPSLVAAGTRGMVGNLLGAAFSTTDGGQDALVAAVERAFATGAAKVALCDLARSGDTTLAMARAVGPVLARHPGRDARIFAVRADDDILGRFMIHDGRTESGVTISLALGTVPKSLDDRDGFYGKRDESPKTVCVRFRCGALEDEREMTAHDYVLWKISYGLLGKFQQKP